VVVQNGIWAFRPAHGPAPMFISLLVGVKRNGGGGHGTEQGYRPVRPLPPWPRSELAGARPGRRFRLPSPNPREREEDEGKLDPDSPRAGMAWRGRSTTAGGHRQWRL
jgi:hypothetical protein